MLTFHAKNLKTGEEFDFTFNDLYGYGGEICGVCVAPDKDKKRPNEVIVYNKGSQIFDEFDTEGNQIVRNAPDGLNPDLEITVLQVE